MSLNASSFHSPISVYHYVYSSPTAVQRASVYLTMAEGSSTWAHHFFASSKMAEFPLWRSEATHWRKLYKASLSWTNWASRPFSFAHANAAVCVREGVFECAWVACMNVRIWVSERVVVCVRGLGVCVYVCRCVRAVVRA